MTCTLHPGSPARLLTCSHGLAQVCNDPGGLLEQISGVADLIAGLDDLDLDMSDDEDDEEEEEEGEEV